MARAAAKLWSPTDTPEIVYEKMRQKAAKRAELYKALLTHEYLSTEAVVKKVGKDPAANSDVTTVLGMLKALREEGLIVSEKAKPVPGKRAGGLKHKKCETPLLIPQQSPRRLGKKKAAASGRASSAPRQTNGDHAPKQADPIQVMIEAVEGLVDAAQQALRTVRIQADRVVRTRTDVGDMKKEMRQLTQKLERLGETMPGRALKGRHH